MPEIPDNFKRKKRRKRLAEYDEETEYFDDNDDFWDFYPDDRNVTEMDIPRIDFAKLGQVSTSKSQQIVKSSSLPDTIYCDLVTTLPTKCLQECNPHNTDSYKLRSVAEGSPTLLNKIFQPIN